MSKIDLGGPEDDLLNLISIVSIAGFLYNLIGLIFIYIHKIIIALSNLLSDILSILGFDVSPVLIRRVPVIIVVLLLFLDSL
ncbi:hypothetical protein [Anaerococcus sp.]|uniref:hypothetical protein n=1 Tax=Anaerococcus sp. TaxID=1872515 RepID=UPI00280C3110|nr:hypothetical protein [Anaerococcus sp.]MDU3176674.1 hypothetical protein [Anaerococcus sp.]